MTAKEVEKALARKFSPPYFAFFPQFRDATGWEGTRTADAVAFGLYASRGYVVHGFEIKVNRGDWLSELKKPEKSEAVSANCDCWWIVAPKGVIMPGEVPAKWGQLEASRRGIRGIKDIHAKETDSPIDRHFVASLVQRALGGARAGDVISVADHREALEDSRKEAKKEALSSFERERLEHQRLERRVKVFEEKTGLSLSYRDQLGEQVALLQSLEPGWFMNQAENAADALENHAKEIRERLAKARKELDGIRGGKANAG